MMTAFRFIFVMGHGGMPTLALSLSHVSWVWVVPLREVIIQLQLKTSGNHVIKETQGTNKQIILLYIQLSLNGNAKCYNLVIFATSICRSALES